MKVRSQVQQQQQAAEVRSSENRKKDVGRQVEKFSALKVATAAAAAASTARE